MLTVKESFMISKENEKDKEIKKKPKRRLLDVGAFFLKLIKIS